MSNKETSNYKVISKNRKAHHDYAIEETFEAGIVLTGTEVKSLREHNAQITDAFAIIRDGEAFLLNVYIAPYSHGNIANVESDRRRKLLLHKREIRYLIGKTQDKGYTLVPLLLYFDNHSRVKLKLGLGKGKKLWDKRQDMAKRDSDRDIRRQLKVRNQ
ncbi:MAG: SsrA-binding protein SmpB [Coriobacteriia bacterium]|nr:SsrA-binding protein SmpB [Coriobacteriia bacterium]